MEEIKKVETRGRKKGYSPDIKNPKVKNKTEKILGYKYTPEEYEIINSVLEELKVEHKTTSKAILELCKSYRNKK